MPRLLRQVSADGINAVFVTTAPGPAAASSTRCRQRGVKSLVLPHTRQPVRLPVDRRLGALGSARLPDDEPAGYPDDLVAQLLAGQGREESLGGL